MTALRDIVGAAADLVLGSSCVGCTRPGPALCHACTTQLQQLPYLAWPVPRPAGLPAPYAVAAYAGPVQAAVVAHKERAVLTLARPLGRALALSVLAAAAAEPPAQRGSGSGSGCPVSLVLPPSAEGTVRERGHDPLKRIVQSCRRSLGAAGVASVVVAALDRARRVDDQAGLSARDRATNLAGAFVVRPGMRLDGRRLVIVDDVLTTGATAAEMARALRTAGAVVPALAVVAATERRRL